METLALSGRSFLCQKKGKIMKTKEQEILNALLASEVKVETPILTKLQKPRRRRSRGLFAMSQYTDPNSQRLGAMPFTVRVPS